MFLSFEYNIMIISIACFVINSSKIYRSAVSPNPSARAKSSAGGNRRFSKITTLKCCPCVLGLMYYYIMYVEYTCNCIVNCVFHLYSSAQVIYPVVKAHSWHTFNALLELISFRVHQHIHTQAFRFKLIGNFGQVASYPGIPTQLYIR